MEEINVVDEERGQNGCMMTEFLFRICIKTSHAWLMDNTHSGNQSKQMIPFLYPSLNICSQGFSHLKNLTKQILLKGLNDLQWM